MRPGHFGLAELERGHPVVDQLRRRPAQRLFHSAWTRFRQIVAVDSLLQLLGSIMVSLNDLDRLSIFAPMKHSLPLSPLKELALLSSFNYST